MFFSKQKLASSKKKELTNLTRTSGLYNMIPNLVWTGLFLIPITVFCYRYVPPAAIYAFLGVSLVPIFFPNSFFDRIQLNRNPSWYRKIGVRHINTLAQNGRIINQLLRKRYPGFKAVSRSRASIKKQYYQTYFFEKFHFSLFLFFTIMTIYAAIEGHFDWVIILTISNLLYNVYPNLLQQYIRLKLKSAHQHIADR